jgi:hypothetical protein
MKLVPRSIIPSQHHCTWPPPHDALPITLQALPVHHPVLTAYGADQQQRQQLAAISAEALTAAGARGFNVAPQGGGAGRAAALAASRRLKKTTGTAQRGARAPAARRRVALRRYLCGDWLFELDETQGAGRSLLWSLWGLDGLGALGWPVALLLWLSCHCCTVECAPACTAMISIVLACTSRPGSLSVNQALSLADIVYCCLCAHCCCFFCFFT